jgi:hypothetical protein
MPERKTPQARLHSRPSSCRDRQSARSSRPSFRRCGPALEIPLGARLAGEDRLDTEPPRRSQPAVRRHQTRPLPDRPAPVPCSTRANRISCTTSTAAPSKRNSRPAPNRRRGKRGDQFPAGLPLRPAGVSQIEICWSVCQFTGCRPSEPIAAPTMAAAGTTRWRLLCYYCVVRSPGHSSAPRS